MNYLGTKAAAVVAACALLATACSPSGAAPSSTAPKTVDEARAAALGRLDELVFAESPDERRAEVQAAQSVEAVESALSAAEESNRTQGDIYWKCAADLVEKLPGRWNGQAPSDDGSQFNDYVLELGDGGTAALSLVGSAEMMSPMEPTEVSSWLASAVGEVDGWKGDLADVVEVRRLPAGLRPEMSGTQVCRVPFSLTFTAGVDEVVWEANLQRGFRGDMTLFLDDQPLDLVDE